MPKGWSQSKRADRRRKKDRAVTFGLALVGFGLSFVGIQWACLAWGLGLLFFVDWLGNTESLASASNPKRRVCQLLAIATVCCVAFSPVRRQYRRERAAETRGYIAARNPQALLMPVLEFGDSGVTYNWHSKDQQLRLLSDAPLRLEMGDDGIEISTVIRDRNDRLVVQVDKNHWFVPPNASTDKNYTDDALEVKDEGGHVVFQTHILSDRIQLRGEWHDAFGGGVQIGECQLSEKIGGCIRVFGPNLPEKTSKTLIDPIFEYPSIDHWGEFLKPTPR
jgi:hypothetical protein